MRRIGRALTVAGRVVQAVTLVAGGILVLAIALVALEADRDHAFVERVLDVATWLAGPFEDAFTQVEGKREELLELGLATLVYSVPGLALAGLLMRRDPRPALLRRRRRYRGDDTGDGGGDGWWDDGDGGDGDGD